MPSRILTVLSAAILLSLTFFSTVVMAVDTDELLDTSDVGENSSTDEAASISALLGESTPAGIAKDVVVVLDNSGSMKKNDPDFLANQAVAEFISGLDTQTRIAIVIFDQDVSLAVPLTNLSVEARGAVLDSLKKVNYRGLFTDSPAAIERAIYELKSNGRADAQKIIVFMTDGIVDTGKADVDLEKSKWLKEDLAADAADESIRVFAIAFTEAADFQLIQSIAQKTDGEYYRALQAVDLQKVFKQINTIINKPPEPEVTIKPVTEIQPPPAPVVQQPVIIEVPAQPKTMGKEERLRSTIVIVIAAVLVIVLLAIVFILLRRSKDTDSDFEIGTEAFINDIHNHTGTGQYKLGQKPTMFGRVAGKDTEHLNYLVIPESTIGRRHALIEYKDYGFWISDQGSINGTFVNDNLIAGEVCLKHGDKVRLHKFEFEFSMPEMDEAGMTVVSHTTYAAPAAGAEEEEATVLKGNAKPAAAADDLEPEFDITGGMEPEFSLEMNDENEEETLIRGNKPAEDRTDQTDAGADDETEDETLLPGTSSIGEDPTEGDAVEEIRTQPDDETLMRGEFVVEEDEDMTIRKVTDEGLEDDFDIGPDEKDDKNR